jgi:PhnB protein
MQQPLGRIVSMPARAARSGHAGIEVGSSQPDTRHRLQGIDVYIPPGFTTVFPYIFVTDARSYLTFLVQGLGGEVLDVLASPDGVVRNAHVRFGDTTIMVSEAGSVEPSRGTYYLYVEDADAAMAGAVAAGGRSLGPVANMPYNDRQGGVADPSGNIWWLSQRLVPGPY